MFFETKNPAPAGFFVFIPFGAFQNIPIPLPALILISIIMKTGKVKFFNNTKGFGFINDNETGKDVFVHSSGLKDQIREGDDVEFELQEGKRGLNAVNVRKAH
jgi:CspA family cold shock protein